MPEHVALRELRDPRALSTSCPTHPPPPYPSLDVDVLPWILALKMFAVCGIVANPAGLLTPGNTMPTDALTATVVPTT